MVAKKTRTRKAPAKTLRPKVAKVEDPSATTTIPPTLREFLEQTATPKGFVNPRPVSADALRKR